MTDIYQGGGRGGGGVGKGGGGVVSTLLKEREY